mmetsp:Transcript_21047/g.58667  ORF Transcript_21047/g.58667 Transcript_21047/m.58667 type:complete len:1065 (-) Transcript_21047:16-3210(-)
MGCGCVTQHQAALSVSGPRLFLRDRQTESEFVQSLGDEETQDRKLLLAYFHRLHENNFEATPQFFELVRRRGVPQRYRWLAWRAIAAWSPHYKAATWERLSRRSADPKAVDAIVKDLDRTFPSREDFGDERKAQLSSILKAFACMFPQVGYCQGMNFVAGFILLHAPDCSSEQAFFMLVEIMARYKASLLFCDGLPLLKLYTYQFRVLLERLFPDVHRHFARENITPELYVTKWFLTVFTQPLPFPVTVRMWDLVLCDGLESLVLLALSTVKLLRARLLRRPTDGIMELLSLRGESGLPSGCSIVRAAIGMKKSSPCGPGVDVRLAKLRQQWAREFPQEAGELDKAEKDLCVGEVPLSAQDEVAVDSPEPQQAAPELEANPDGAEDAPTGIRARVRSLTGCSARSSRRADSAASASTGLPPAAEVALAAAAAAGGEEAKNLETVNTSSTATGTLSTGHNLSPSGMGRGSDNSVSSRGSSNPELPPEGYDVGQEGQATLMSGIAPSGKEHIGGLMSPHTIGDEAKVELESSMPPRRTASVRMIREDASSGASPAMFVCSERAPLDQQRPWNASLDDEDWSAKPQPQIETCFSGISHRSAASNAPLLPQDDDHRASRSSARNASGHATATNLVASGSPPAKQPDLGGMVAKGWSRNASGHATATNLVASGSPPAKQPDLGGMVAKGWSRLMSPVKEDDRPLPGGGVRPVPGSGASLSSAQMRPGEHAGQDESMEEARSRGGNHLGAPHTPLRPATARAGSINRSGSRGSSTERDDADRAKWSARTADGLPPRARSSSPPPSRQVPAGAAEAAALGTPPWPTTSPPPCGGGSGRPARASKSPGYRSGSSHGKHRRTASGSSRKSERDRGPECVRSAEAQLAAGLGGVVLPLPRTAFTHATSPIGDERELTASESGAASPPSCGDEELNGSFTREAWGFSANAWSSPGGARGSEEEDGDEDASPEAPWSTPSASSPSRPPRQELQSSSGAGGLLDTPVSGDTSNASPCVRTLFLDSSAPSLPTGAGVAVAESAACAASAIRVTAGGGAVAGSGPRGPSTSKEEELRPP